MEHWLSVDLSSKWGTVALHQYQSDKPQFIGGVDLPEMRHCEELVPALNRLLEMFEVELADVSRFICPEGPGSFTGLRIATATLKAMALTFGKPIDTLSSTEARGLGWLDHHPAKAGERLVVITQMARQSYVVSTFEVAEKGILPVSETVETTLEQLELPSIQIAEEFPSNARFFGDHLLDAVSRRTHSTQEEVVRMSPRYLGSTRFD